LGRKRHGKGDAQDCVKSSRGNISIETIARTTGLSIAQIHQIQAENQQ
jgi:hypothetical protein